MKIKKGDTVKIMLGKDKSRSGEVLAVYPKANKVLVKGLNIYKKHLKAQPGRQGSILEKERPLWVSQIQLICPHCKKTVRVSYQTDKSGQKFRQCKKCQQLVDKNVK